LNQGEDDSDADDNDNEDEGATLGQKRQILLSIQNYAMLLFTLLRYYYLD
jgi:hypothetical protein